MVMLHHILTLAALFLVNVTFCADVSSAISAAVSTIHTGTANDCVSIHTVIVFSLSSFLIALALNLALSFLITE